MTSKDAESMECRDPNSTRTKRRSYRLPLVAIIVVAASCAGWIVLYRWANPGYEPQPFDAERWAKAGAEERGYMARDLLKRHPMTGLTREQVEGIIGPPDEDQRDLERYRYYLGNMGRNPDQPFFWGMSLLVTFDEEGRVVTAFTAD